MPKFQISQNLLFFGGEQSLGHLKIRFCGTKKKFHREGGFYGRFIQNFALQDLRVGQVLGK